MRELKIPIVLWIPSRIFAQLAKKSPDFYSWRNGIFQFQPEPSLVTTEPLVSQGIEFTEGSNQFPRKVPRCRNPLFTSIINFGNIIR